MELSLRTDRVLRREGRGALALSLVLVVITGVSVVSFSPTTGGGYRTLAVLFDVLFGANALYYVGRYRALRRLSRLAALAQPATGMWMTTWSEPRVEYAGMWPAGVIPAGKPGSYQWVGLSPAPDSAPVLCVCLLAGHGLIHTTGPEPVDVLGTTRPRGRIVIRRSGGEVLWPDGLAKAPSRAKGGGASRTDQ